MKVLKISSSTLYAKLDFIHRQCLLFAGARERTLFEKKDLGKRYITTDRQKLMVNWSSRQDRRNTAMLSLASADLTTGYVFAVNLNYDAALDEQKVRADALRYGDNHLSKPYRRYARVWLPEDFEGAGKRAAYRRDAALKAKTEGLPPLTEDQALIAGIRARYAAAAAREDIESGNQPEGSEKTPVLGMLVHEQVVMNAHFQYLARLLHHAPKLRFFVDLESGLRAAFMAALPKRIIDRTADGFYVTTLKDATIDEKRMFVNRSAALFAAAKATAEPDATSDDVKILLARREMDRMVSLGKWDDKWFKHPIANMRELEKSICWLTDIDEPETGKDEREDQLNHFASLYLMASLTAVDRFFMQVRRGITMAERSVSSASSDRRVWSGKSAYNPGNLVKLMEIFRTYFNYCEIGKDRRTPAMRLGLAKGPIDPEDILYFAPEPPPRLRSRIGESKPRQSRKKADPSQLAPGGVGSKSTGGALATP